MNNLQFISTTNTTVFIFYYNRLASSRFYHLLGWSLFLKSVFLSLDFLFFSTNQGGIEEKLNLLYLRIDEIGKNITEQSQNYNTGYPKYYWNIFQSMCSNVRLDLFFVILPFEKRLSLIMSYWSRKTLLHIEKYKGGRNINHNIWPKILLGMSCISVFFTVTFR